ncbi:MAG: hypothetical protein ACYTHM_19650 [Planctomycetota bacterium]
MHRFLKENKDLTAYFDRKVADETQGASGTDVNLKGNPDDTSIPDIISGDVLRNPKKEGEK